MSSSRSSRNTMPLYPVHCDKCGRYLADILPTASAICPSCSKWNFPDAPGEPAAAPVGQRDRQDTLW